MNAQRDSKIGDNSMSSIGEHHWPLWDVEKCFTTLANQIIDLEILVGDFGKYKTVSKV